MISHGGASLLDRKGGGVASISNSDGSLTISPTTGAIVASINLAHTNIFTVDQQFTSITNTDGNWVINDDGSAIMAGNGNLSWDSSGNVYAQGTLSAGVVSSSEFDGGQFYGDFNGGYVSGNGSGLYSINLSSQNNDVPFLTSPINIVSDTTGTLTVARGGTGATTFTAGYVLFGNGTSAINSSSALTYSSSLLNITKDSDATVWTSAPLRITAASNSNKQLQIGYDNTRNVGWMQSGVAGSAYTGLLIAPNGGNVGIGSTSPGDVLTVAGNISLPNGGLLGFTGNTTVSYSAYALYGDANYTILNVRSGGVAQIHFRVNNSTGMEMDSGGSLGVGMLVGGSPATPSGVVGGIYAGYDGIIGRTLYVGPGPYTASEGIQVTAISSAGTMDLRSTYATDDRCILRFSSKTSSYMYFGVANNTNLAAGNKTQYAYYDSAANVNAPVMVMNDSVARGGDGFSGVYVPNGVPQAIWHVVGTTEQLRLGYDASNYYKTTVGSTGGVTFDAVGSGAGFTFADQITGSAGYVGSDLTASALVLTDSGKKLISGTVTNLATAGIPTITNVSLTGQTADITATNLATVAGLYSVSYSLQDTTADITAGAVVLTISYTDGAGATTATATQVLTGVGRQSGSVYIQLASGNLTYAITHTGLFGTATYALYISTERLK